MKSGYSMQVAALFSLMALPAVSQQPKAEEVQIKQSEYSDPETGGKNVPSYSCSGSRDGDTFSAFLIDMPGDGIDMLTLSDQSAPHTYKGVTFLGELVNWNFIRINMSISGAQEVMKAQCGGQAISVDQVSEKIGGTKPDESNSLENN